MRRTFIAGIGALTLSAFIAASGRAVVAQGASTATPQYSAAQADRGLALYTSSCSMCHGADLAGSTTIPPLKGMEFESYWLGKPVGELFDKINTTMPKTEPGSLKPEQSAELVAYILRELKAPAGTADLTSKLDDLNKITIDRSK